MGTSLYGIKQMFVPDRKNVTPKDNDFKIRDSWIEYKDNDKPMDKKILDYLCFKLEVKNPDTGERQVVYKAVKFVRIVRLPESAQQSTSLMQMHSQVLSACWKNEINLVGVIANILHSVREAVGLFYLYGVQGVAENITAAKRKADKDFEGLLGSLQGTYRVLHMKYLNAYETEWLRDKLALMEFVTVVRGIPKASDSGEDGGNKGMGGKNLNPDSQGTLEELIAAMSDYEYVMEVLTSPVPPRYLEALHAKKATEMTKWYSQLQGNTSLTASLNLIPMAFGTNSGNSGNWGHNYTDSSSINYNQSVSNNYSVGENIGQSLSHNFSESFGQNQSVSVGQTIGTSHTVGVGTSDTVSQGVNQGVSFGQNINNGLSHGFSMNEGSSAGTNQGFNESQSTNFGINEGISANQGTSFGVNQGTSTSESMNHGLSTNQNYGVNNSHSFGVNQGTSYNIGRGENLSQTVSENTSLSNSVGSSHTASQGSSITSTQGQSWGQNLGYNHSANTGQSYGVNNGQSAGFNWGQNQGYSAGYNSSTNSSSSSSVEIKPSFFGNSIGGINTSTTHGNSIGSNFSNSAGANWGGNYGVSSGESYGASFGTSDGVSYGQNTGISNSLSQGQNYSVSQGINQSTSLTEGYGYSQSQGTSINESFGTSMGTSENVSVGNSQSFGYGESVGYGSTVSNNAGISQGMNQSMGQSFGTSQGISSSLGDSFGVSQGVNSSQGMNVGANTSNGYSFGQNVGSSLSTSHGVSTNESWGENISKSQTVSVGNSQTISNGVSEGINWGQSRSVGTGTNTGSGSGYSTSTGLSRGGGWTTGASSNMSMGVSLGISKSYQWLDQEVKDLIEVMEFTNERYKSSLRQGAFYTHVYIACPTQQALDRVMVAAGSTWQNEQALASPLQVLNLSEEEQKHLLYHASAFSTDVTKVDVGGLKRAKYETLLLPDELNAYTHLPRIDVGGVFAEIKDIPHYAVPSQLKGDIYMGTILNASIWSMENGYKTNYEYRLDESALMHGVFIGASRSGKTVAAMRFVAALTRVRRSKTGKRLRIVCLDPKRDWRGLSKYVEPERFKFGSLGNLFFHPIKINVWKVPKGVGPQLWIDGIIDIYCRAYGLLELGKQMIADVVYKLYEEEGVFDAMNKQNWKELVPELSSHVSFEKIAKKMEARRDALTQGGKAGRNTMDAYERLLERLNAFRREFSIEHILFGTEEGLGIDDLVGDDDVTVLESKGLENTFKNFIFGAITDGFFKYAQVQENGFLSDDQYETVLVIEEANEVLTGSDNASSSNDAPSLTGESAFEVLLDQAAGFGLFVFAITQKISAMPSSLIANVGLKFVGRLNVEKDITTSAYMIGQEPRYEDRDLVKWLPRAPIGHFICQSSRGFDFIQAEPVLVQIEPLETPIPSNEELDEILLMGQLKQTA